MIPMQRRFTGRAMLISGASGIAAAAARIAATEGASVFITSLGDEECVMLVNELRALGARAGSFTADLTDSQAVEEAVDSCVEVYGRIDALFNVAGISGRRFGDGPLHECSEEGWDTTLAVNLKSMFLLTRQVLNQMLGQEPGPNGQRGAIVNMGSVSAFSPQPDYFAAHAYAAAKGAVESLTKAAASYYARHRIRVNAIAPGLVRTPMSRRAQSNEEIMRFIERKQPLLGGIIEPEAAARAALFLLSDEALPITGEVLAVDAGWRVA